MMAKFLMLIVAAIACGSDSSDGSESDNTSDDKPGCKRDASDRVSSRPGAT